MGNQKLDIFTFMLWDAISDAKDEYFQMLHITQNDKYSRYNELALKSRLTAVQYHQSIIDRNPNKFIEFKNKFLEIVDEQVTILKRDNEEHTLDGFSLKEYNENHEVARTTKNVNGMKKLTTDLNLAKREMEVGCPQMIFKYKYFGKKYDYSKIL